MEALRGRSPWQLGEPIPTDIEAAHVLGTSVWYTWTAPATTVVEFTVDATATDENAPWLYLAVCSDVGRTPLQSQSLLAEGLASESYPDTSVVVRVSVRAGARLSLQLDVQQGSGDFDAASLTWLTAGERCWCGVMSCDVMSCDVL
jgi:hypothetical protein